MCNKHNKTLSDLDHASLQNLSRWLDDELPASDAERMLQQLAGVPSEQLALFTELHHQLRDHDQTASAFLQAVHAKQSPVRALRPRTNKPRLPNALPLWSRPALAVAAMLLIAVGGVWMWFGVAPATQAPIVAEVEPRTSPNSSLVMAEPSGPSVDNLWLQHRAYAEPNLRQGFLSYRSVGDVSGFRLQTVGSDRL